MHAFSTERERLMDEMEDLECRIQRLERAMCCEKCGANNIYDVLAGRITLRDWLNNHPCGSIEPDDGGGE